MKTDDEALSELRSLLSTSETFLEEVELDPNDDAAFDAALRRYGLMRNLMDRVTKARNELDLLIDRTEQSLIPVLERRRIKSIKVAGLGLIGTRTNNNPKVVSEYALHDWLKTNGEDGIIRETVNYQTLKKFMNDRIDAGLDVPGAEIVEMTPRQGLYLKRG